MPFRPLQGYFYLYLHSTLISHIITLYFVPPTFVRLHITLIQLQLHFPLFPGLIPHTSTLIHLVLPCSFDYSLILLWSCLIFRYIHRTLYPDPLTHLHPLSDHFGVRYQPWYHHFGHIGTVYQNFTLFRSFSLVLWCWCDCFLTIQHSWTYQRWI
jgi:hypothetical protein